MNRAADSPVLAPDNMFSDRAPGRVSSGQVPSISRSDFFTYQSFSSAGNAPKSNVKFRVSLRCSASTASANAIVVVKVMKQRH